MMINLKRAKKSGTCFPKGPLLLMITMICLCIFTQAVTGAVTANDPLDNYNVIWNTPSKDASGSMPIGNGDIGLNVWVEENGDLQFYVSKTDSWSENARLLKLGRVRVKLSPNPFESGLLFRQILKLRQGEIEIAAGKEDSPITLNIWVDANNPVIRVEAECEEEFEVKVSLETWREKKYELKSTTTSDIYNVFTSDDTNFATEGNLYPTIVYPDVIVPVEKDRVVWYHHNIKSGWPVTMTLQGFESLMDSMTDPLLGRTFGGAIKGQGFIKVDDRTLKTSRPQKQHTISIHALTRHPSTPEEWLKKLDETIARTEKISIETALEAHRKWWNDFWSRSWIRISEPGDGKVASNGYTLFRYMLACGGRGAQPIKFNGSIFTTPHEGDPDYRQWGPGFWWQNQRLFYWPMMVSGDYDLIQPFFSMYVNALPLATSCNRIYYGHDGAHFPETIYFWGNCTNDHYGWNRENMPAREVECKYVAMEWQGGLELLAIMLDYYSHTQDEEFLKDKLLRTANEIITFYDLHYKRDENGKLYIWPSQALETWWECENPMPEVAGLKFVLGKLLNLPVNLTNPEQRSKWERLLSELPPVPTRQEKGQTILSPADTYAVKNNIENPELYAVFPYRLYGVGKPNLEMARLAFDNRLHIEGNYGHDQDDAHAAYLGLTEKVREFITRRLGSKYLVARFPTMWHGGYDWPPDHCHGGNGMIALHAMLMQCEDEKILLFPAWPKEWDVDFKLHAPYKTVVECVYKNGEIVSLEVIPESRKKDVVIMDPQ